MIDIYELLETQPTDIFQLMGYKEEHHSTLWIAPVGNSDVSQLQDEYPVGTTHFIIVPEHSTVSGLLGITQIPTQGGPVGGLESILGRFIVYEPYKYGICYSL